VQSILFYLDVLSARTVRHKDWWRYLPQHLQYWL